MCCDGASRVLVSRGEVEARMKSWRTNLLAYPALLLFLGAATVMGQSPESRFETLTLTIGVPDQGFLPLEPVPIKLQLLNGTDRDVMGHTAIDLTAGRIRLVIQPEGAPAYEVDDLSTFKALVLFKQPTIIKPGQKAEIKELLDFNLDKMFPRPGRYTVQAVLSGVDPREQVTSNVVSLQLREPSGVEQAAHAFIHGSGAASYIFTGVVDDRLQVQLEELVLTFGDTVYADYGNLVLGTWNAGKGDYRTARHYLSRVTKKRDFPLTDCVPKFLSWMQRKESGDIPSGSGEWPKCGRGER